MNLQLHRPNDAYTLAETILIARATHACWPLCRRFTGRTPEGHAYDQVAAAMVFANPLRIDFTALTPGELGQAFLGPQTPLTDDLFDGVQFTAAYLAEITAAQDAYARFMRTPMERPSDPDSANPT